MLSWIEVSRSALENNYRVFCNLVGKKHVAPVIKANAYGHGFDEVASVLMQQSPDWLCGNYASEGVSLRKMGYQGRIVIVGPMNKESMAEAAAHDLEVFLGSFDGLQTWEALSSRPKLHIKFDTGMSRQGFLIKDLGAILPRLLPHFQDIRGVCTHFANVEDVTEQGYALQQLNEFDQAVAALKNHGLTNFVAHTAASASCLLVEKSRLDLSRIGISLYGLWPSQATKISYLQEFGSLIDLIPALSWKTKITQLKTVDAGRFIGYGCTFRALRDMRVAVLPVGYHEGYPRIAGSTSSYVLVRGKRSPVVGRLCMNMMMVDVSHISHVDVGDTVTLIGTDESETVSSGDLGIWSQTIHYEILSRLHPGIPRLLVD